MKEIQGVFDYNDMLLTSTFGSNDNDNQFDENDRYLLEMSKHLDFIHLSKKSAIIGSIKMGVPPAKIIIQQQLNVYTTDPIRIIPYSTMCKLNSYSKTEYSLPLEKICDAEKCHFVADNKTRQLTDSDYIRQSNKNEHFYYESSRHIANKASFVIEHDLAGVLVFSPINDDTEGLCQIEQDTFIDFRPMEGIYLNVPTQSKPFSRVQVIIDAFIVYWDKIAQEAQLKAK